VLHGVYGVCYTLCFVSFQLCGLTLQSDVASLASLYLATVQALAVILWDLLLFNFVHLLKFFFFLNAYTETVIISINGHWWSSISIMTDVSINVIGKTCYSFSMVPGISSVRWWKRGTSQAWSSSVAGCVKTPSMFRHMLMLLVSSFCCLCFKIYFQHKTCITCISQ